MFLLVLESFGLDVIVFFAIRFLCLLTGDAVFAGILIIVYVIIYLITLGGFKWAFVMDSIYDEYEEKNEPRFFEGLFTIAVRQACRLTNR